MIKEKFHDLDEKFIAQRNRFFETQKLDSKFCIDNWGLFAGSVPIGVYIARYEILKMVIDIPGHILEFGCFNGSNLLYMAKIMELLAPGDLKKIFGFDSFQGLSSLDEKDGSGIQQKGRYVGNQEILEKMIKLHCLEDRVHLIVGDIKDTLPKFLAEKAHHCYSLIYLDADLYASTKIVLDLCWERLVPGGIIVFDEGYHDRFPGEGIARNEFVKAIPSSYECGSFPFARQPMIWIRKK